MIADRLSNKSIIKKIKAAKNYSIMIDGTPDCSHKEQLSFIIRYVKTEDTEFSIIEERFIGYYEFSKKIGGWEIAEKILEVLASLLNFNDGVGQGYDNSANMSGKYNGVQAVLEEEEEKNQNCVLSSCGNHTLNLVTLVLIVRKHAMKQWLTLVLVRSDGKYSKKTLVRFIKYQRPDGRPKLIALDQLLGIWIVLTKPLELVNWLS